MTVVPTVDPCNVIVIVVIVIVMVMDMVIIIIIVIVIVIVIVIIVIIIIIEIIKSEVLFIFDVLNCTKILPKFTGLLLPQPLTLVPTINPCTDQRTKPSTF